MLLYDKMFSEITHISIFPLSEMQQSIGQEINSVWRGHLFRDSSELP